jgi:ribosome biogenesis SPOUT family RNA methylase Rps3
MPKYIIEHLEEELFDWCFIEYKSMSEAVGKDNLIITNVSSKKDRDKLKNYADVREESVRSMNLKNACLLDMIASKELSPKDKFDFYIFGGILGDDPPRSRTKEFFSWFKGETRHLGKMQMATDNAVLCTKMISDGKKLSEIAFIDNPDFPMEDGLELNMPYRYVAVNGKPHISKELMEHIKKSGF